MTCPSHCTWTAHPDVATLRKVAQAATPGPWVYEDAPNGQAPLVIGSDMAVAETFDKPHLSDAAHIAAFDPPTVLALLDRLGAAEAAPRHIAGLLRKIADEPISAELDRLTWRAALLAAARIVEEDAALREDRP